VNWTKPIGCKIGGTADLKPLLSHHLAEVSDRVLTDFTGPGLLSIRNQFHPAFFKRMFQPIMQLLADHNGLIGFNFFSQCPHHGQIFDGHHREKDSPEL
jgi:hypothetical protein